MATQVALLKESLARQVAMHGADDPFAKALRQQIASLESRQPDESRPNPVTLFAGTRSAPKK